MPEPHFTPAARRHIHSLLRAIAPFAARLNRQFRADLLRRQFNSAQTRALLAITPAALCGTRTLPQALEQVEYHGARLARLNVPPGEAATALDRFSALLPPVLGGAHQPALEQLRLATTLALNDAYYRVREAESQTFFGIERAEIEARDLEDFLRRAMGVLTRSFRASAGRLLLECPPSARLARPLYIERGAGEAWPPWPVPNRCVSWWSYPLQSGGLILLGFPKPYPWLPRELALLQAIAGRCDEAMQRERARTRMRLLDAEARAAQEQERRRIGRDLHDEAGQSLMLLRLQLEMLQRDAPPALRTRLSEIRSVADAAITEVRRIVSALGPEVLERLGLEAAIRQLAVRFRKIHPAALRLRIGRLPRVAPKIQEALYRAAQELLQNAAKHSRAARVNLSLIPADKSIRLCVSDNGDGFRAETAENGPIAFGLSGLRERAVMLGGMVRIRSAPSKGTSVSLLLPWEPHR
jgi:signal transduction histidine kinase